MEMREVVHIQGGTPDTADPERAFTAFYQVPPTGLPCGVIPCAARQLGYGRAGPGAQAPYASLSSCRCRPSPPTSSSTTSPARRYGFGSGRPMATPAGVPVLITSPG